jgi:hypothetical protein
LPSSAAPRKPPSMPCLMTKVYVGCDIMDKSPMARHTDSLINSAVSQETTMLCMYVCQPLSPSLFHRDSPLPTNLSFKPQKKKKKKKKKVTPRLV